LGAVVNENVQLGTRLLLVLPASPIAALICSSSLFTYIERICHVEIYRCRYYWRVIGRVAAEKFA
jgi:hypothetical protein